MLDLVADEFGVDFPRALDIFLASATPINCLRAQAEANAVRCNQLRGTQQAEDATARGATVGGYHDVLTCLIA